MESDSRTIRVTVDGASWERTVTGVAAYSQRVVCAALAAAAPRLTTRAEVSLLLTDDKTMRILNHEWRGIDRPTNVLAFPAQDDLWSPPADGPLILGDIVIAYETLHREALAEGKALNCHLAHLLVHGTLHLLGYDHVEPGETEAMERREVEILAMLGVANPYEGELAS